MSREPIKNRDLLKNQFTFHNQFPLDCPICKESRVLELCHIVPVIKGGSNRIHNLIYLCPTHHKLLDKGLLNDIEYAIIRKRVEYAKHKENSIAPKSEKKRKKIERLSQVHDTVPIETLYNDVQTIVN